MRWRNGVLTVVAALLSAALPALEAAPFGKVVAIGGQASDLALDEGRGLLYVANFTAGRIEVMTLSTGRVETSMNVAPQPGALALSPDKRFLLVAHFGNFASPVAPRNSLTLIELDSARRQTFALGSPPLAASFGNDGLALIVTSTEFLLFDPLTGSTRLLDTVANVTARTLPQPVASAPPQIVAAASAASGDGTFVFGLTDTIRFRYDVAAKRILSLGYTSSPPFGPRTVSVNHDGSAYTAGWGLFNTRGTLTAQFPNPLGSLNLGGHAMDGSRGVVYGQVPEAPPGAAAGGGAAGGGGTGGGASGGGGSSVLIAPANPTLTVWDIQNLAVLEKYELAENLGGRAVLSADNGTLYAISDSGVTIFPVGALDRERRIAASVEDVVFRINNCDRRIMTHEVLIQDLSGESSDFALSTVTPGVRFSPANGRTPATVRVSIDPTAFAAQQGTAVATIAIRSAQSVRIPDPIRVLINTREPDQRGTTVNVPGKLVDLLADPVHDRFFILRQDRNQVLVYDAATYQLTKILKTGNTPTQMALSADRRSLFVGNDNSQIASVFDLETLEAEEPIVFPGGHYPRSIASTGGATIAAVRVAGPKHKIDRVEMVSRRAIELATLGVWENDINIQTTLVASANGASIVAAQADGNVLLFDGNAQSFTVWRRDQATLGGAYAASNFDRFVVGNTLLNRSLVPVGQLDSSAGQSSGFVFIDQGGIRTGATTAQAAGVIQRLDFASGDGLRATRMNEAPQLGDVNQPFTRTLAVLASRKALINLTVSGFTVLPWDYDAAVAPPKITSVVNAADGQQPVAPGGLISIRGSQLSPVNLATREIPLPTALGESCLTVNGTPVPVLFVSATQINAQLPFTAEGTVTLILRTPGGVSDNFNLRVLTGAPGVFRANVPGIDEPVATVYNARNSGLSTGSNPVKRHDGIFVLLTGLGRTFPAVETGMPAPAAPLSEALIPPIVTLGGVELPVDYAGLVPGQVGIYQINARIPGHVPTGMSVPLEIAQAGSSTSVAVRVIE